MYHLVPNTTYSFRVWATNQLGKGEIVEVEGHTHYSVEELGILLHNYYYIITSRLLYIEICYWDKVKFEIVYRSL